MASLGSTFDPNAVAPSTGGTGGVHPEGVFQFEIQESEVKATSNGKGQILAFAAINTGADEPELKGRKVFVNINIANESAQAQSIGQGELSALCAAIGFTETLTDSEQLHFQPFYAEVKHEKRMGKDAAGKYTVPQFNDDGTPKMNAVIKRYMFGDAEAPANPPAEKAAPAAPARQAAAPAAPAAGARAWQRKAG